MEKLTMKGLADKFDSMAGDLDDKIAAKVQDKLGDAQRDVQDPKWWEKNSGNVALVVAVLALIVAIF